MSPVSPDQCSHPNTWFDRTLCPEPCGRMHTVCSDCGDVGYCPNEEAGQKAQAAREAAWASFDDRVCDTICFLKNGGLYDGITDLRTWADVLTEALEEYRAFRKHDTA